MQFDIKFADIFVLVVVMGYHRKKFFFFKTGPIYNLFNDKKTGEYIRVDKIMNLE